MEIKQLDYFREIVDSNFNLSKAASKLHVTQPSLSMLITSWEKQYGIKLFNKKNARYHSLTKEGEYIYNHAIALLKLHNDFIYSLEEIKMGFTGSVRIGITSYVLSLLLHKPIVDFISNYPDINLHIVEDDMEELQKKLINSEIDMAILTNTFEDENIILKPIYTDNFVCAMNKSITTETKSTITLEELEKYNMVTFTDNFSLYKQINNLFKDKLLHPNITFKAGQWDIIMDIVNTTKSYSIIPNTLLDASFSNNITIKKIKELDTSWTIALATNKNKIKSPAVKFLEEYLINFFISYSHIPRNTKKAINVK